MLSQSVKPHKFVSLINSDSFEPQLYKTFVGNMPAQNHLICNSFAHLWLKNPLMKLNQITTKT